MMKYEKPHAFLQENLSEGIYLASGEDTADTGALKCQSIYMKGNPVKPVTLHQDGMKMSALGCQGCAACQPWDGGCNLSLAGRNSQLKPTWEVNGYTPDTIFHPGMDV